MTDGLIEMTLILELAQFIHGNGMSINPLYATENKIALARCLLPEIEKFFESEEGQCEFEEWKKK
jgi:hypothetical protein